MMSTDIVDDVSSFIMRFCNFEFWTPESMYPRIFYAELEPEYYFKILHSEWTYKNEFLISCRCACAPCQISEETHPSTVFEDLVKTRTRLKCKIISCLYF